MRGQTPARPGARNFEENSNVPPTQLEEVQGPPDIYLPLKAEREIASRPNIRDALVTSYFSRFIEFLHFLYRRNGRTEDGEWIDRKIWLICSKDQMRDIDVSHLQFDISKSR